MVKQVVLAAAFIVVGIHHFHQAWTEMARAVTIARHGPEDPKR